MRIENVVAATCVAEVRACSWPVGDASVLAMVAPAPPGAAVSVTDGDV